MERAAALEQVVKAIIIGEARPLRKRLGVRPVTFTQVGIPLEAIALVAGVDRIMDMARTTINVLGDATGALFVSKLESDFDPERGERLAAAE